jgi:hypothetical protein
MVSDHGTVSEARQYAGREVGTSWEAPFEPTPDALEQSASGSPGSAGRAGSAGREAGGASVDHALEREERA